MKLVIATRRSPLALWQARHVADALTNLDDVTGVELLECVTEGDRILDRSLAKVGGKGLFIKELEQAMLDGRADLAVHSMKDVPATPPPGFAFPAFLPREDPRDAIVGKPVAELPTGARVGTSSLRRQAQLAAHRPDLTIEPVRGNVGTRLGKLDSGEFDSILLATAGLKRLELEHRIADRFAVETMLPACGQGIVGIECRADASAVCDVLAKLDDPISRRVLTAERAVAAGLEADCHAPLGAHAIVNGDALWLRGRVAAPDGSEIIDAEGRSTGDPAALGREIADALLAKGAARWLGEST
ncbi:MAG: hydroxymethylbilane synthase [Pseudomonadota bacterium]